MPFTQTDVYGTCTSRYERRGPVLLKTRDLTECHRARLANFWPHSVSVTEDTVSTTLFLFKCCLLAESCFRNTRFLPCLFQSVQSELHCVQKHESTLLREVNCTEAISMTTWSKTAPVMRTQTVSSLVLIRAQPVTPLSQGEEWDRPCVIAGQRIIPGRFNPPADSMGSGVPTDLQFGDEKVARPRKDRASAMQEISQTIKTLCSLASDTKTVCSSQPQILNFDCLAIKTVPISVWAAPRYHSNSFNWCSSSEI